VGVDDCSYHKFCQVLALTGHSTKTVEVWVARRYYRQQKKFWKKESRIGSLVRFFLNPPSH
jgi:hypothetical protein